MVITERRLEEITAETGASNAKARIEARATTAARPMPSAAEGSPPEPGPMRRPMLRGLREPLASGTGARLTVAWIVIFCVGVAVEPTAAEDGSLGLVGGVVVTALMASWLGMAAGFLAGRRYGAAASLAGAVALVGMTIGCPASGHHVAIGAWWYVQLVGSSALVAGSLRALSWRASGG